MSGYLRKLLGPARARLTNYLIDADEHILREKGNREVRTKEEENDNARLITSYISKISRSVQSFEGYIKKWMELINSMESARAEEETRTYDAFLVLHRRDPFLHQNQTDCFNGAQMKKYYDSSCPLASSLIFSANWFFTSNPSEPNLERVWTEVLNPYIFCVPLGTSPSKLTSRLFTLKKSNDER